MNVQVKVTAGRLKYNQSFAYKAQLAKWSALADFSRLYILFLRKCNGLILFRKHL